MICEVAPAKVNLTLENPGKRNDGYHELGNQLPVFLELYVKSFSDPDFKKIILRSYKKFILFFTNILKKGIENGKTYQKNNRSYPFPPAIRTKSLKRNYCLPHTLIAGFSVYFKRFPGCFFPGELFRHIKGIYLKSFHQASVT